MYAKCTIAVLRMKRLWEPLPLSRKQNLVKTVLTWMFTVHIFLSPLGFSVWAYNSLKAFHICALFANLQMYKGPRTATRSWLSCTSIISFQFKHDGHRVVVRKIPRTGCLTRSTSSPSRLSGSWKVEHPSEAVDVEKF